MFLLLSSSQAQLQQPQHVPLPSVLPLGMEGACPCHVAAGSARVQR